MPGRDEVQVGRRGLTVFAVDEPGRELAAELCRRAPAGAAVCAFAWTPEGWRCLADGEWRQPSWHGEGKAFATGLEAAVREAFRVDPGAVSESGRKQVDLAFLNPPEGAAEELFSSGGGALAIRLKRRFRGVDRIFVTACRSFETFGASGIPGVLRPLPWGAAVAAGAIDFVLLQDQVNLEDRWLDGPAAAGERLIEAMLQLTLGPAAMVLYPRLQQERERLGPPGAYVAVGCAEWTLSPEGSVSAVADLLCQRMAALVVEAAEPPEQEAQLPDDGWLGEEPLADLPRLGGEGELLREADERSRHRLRDLFFLGHRPGLLLTLVERRLTELRQLEAKAKLRLMHFMESFAPEYSRLKSGRKKDSPPPNTYKEQVRDNGKVARFVAVFVGSVGCVAVVRWTEEKFLGGVGMVLFLVAGVILALRGFKRTRTITETVSVPRPPTSIPELKRQRARVWVVQQLIDCHERLRSSVAEQVEALRQVALGDGRSEFERFPFTHEVCARLLLDFGLDPSVCLARFWSDEPRAWQALTEGDGDELAELLRTFARSFSQPVARVGWPELLGVLGGASAVEMAPWKLGVSRLRQTSLPWVAVAGREAWATVAFPHDLPKELAEALEDQLGMPSLRHDFSGRVLAAQVSQGYKEVGEEGSVDR